jgi:hypothetical protein
MLPHGVKIRKILPGLPPAALLPSKIRLIRPPLPLFAEIAQPRISAAFG